MTAVTPEVVERVRDRLARDGAELTPALVAEALRDDGRPVGDATVLAVHELLLRDLVGAGPLEALLRTHGVTDVLVNGPHAVYVDRGRGLEQVPLAFPDDDAVRRLAQRLATTAGRRLDDASPYVDARLPDGVRLHAVLAPIARPGTLVSLRVPRRQVFTLADLVASGTVSSAGAQLLSRIVERRLAFLVTGGTGTGKTTLLDALLSLVPASERIVIVEDASELRPDHPHAVGLEARRANVEGVGAVELRTLVRQALRMRPDRLVVGEVRGPEIVDLLAAMNTGHEGGCGTVHANSALDVPPRVEALALAGGLPQHAAHSQLAAAVDVVLHLHRTSDGSRMLAEIAVLSRGDSGLAHTSTAVSFDASGALREGPGAARLAALLERA